MVDRTPAAGLTEKQGADDIRAFCDYYDSFHEEFLCKLNRKILEIANGNSR